MNDQKCCDDANPCEECIEVLVGKYLEKKEKPAFASASKTVEEG